MEPIDAMYRAPANPPPQPRFTVAGAMFKWIYAAFVGAGVAAAILARVMDPSSASVLARASGALFLGAMIVGLCWLHAAWSDIPREDRYLTPLGEITPATAVGRLFIPLYNVYWTFAVHSVLCKALTASLRKRNVHLEAEPQLAFLAVGVGLAARVMLMARQVEPAAVLSWGSTAAWFAYMHRCDTFRRMVLLARRSAEE